MKEEYRRSCPYELPSGTTIIGVDALSIPTENSPNTELITVITGGAGYKRGYDGDVAVYYGIGSPEFVAERGAKASFAQAKEFYPMLREEEYRR
jgi:hypothetical protein